MGTRISMDLRDATVVAARTLLDAGSGPAQAKVYSGAQPAGPGSAATGSLLATIPLDDPSFPDPTSGASTIDPDEVNATGSGTAGYLRLEDSDGNGVIDLVCGTSVAVSATAATDLLTTSSAHGLSVGQPVYFTSGIAGLAEGRYIVIATPSASTFKVAVAGSATAVDLTDNGSATFSTAAVAMSTTTVTSGEPVDITAITLAMGAGA